MTSTFCYTLHTASRHKQGSSTSFTQMYETPYINPKTPYINPEPGQDGANERTAG